MRSERQALADIAAEPVQRINPDTLGWISAEHVHAILADVQPEPAPAGGTIDPDALRSALHEILEETADFGLVMRSTEESYNDRILALVRPVEGVVLTTEEAGTAAAALRSRANELRYRARFNPLDASVTGTNQEGLRALAAKLEAAL